MELRLNPLDTLFFRDGKPFAMGEETWADGLFPPNPSVIYGAVRTAFACIEGKEIPFSEVKSKLDEKVLSITDIVYSTGKISYLPMPLDFAEMKSKTDIEKRKETKVKEYKVDLLNIGSKKVITKKEKPYELIYQADFKQVESITDGLISISSLKSYLEGTLNTVKIRRFSDYVVSESKIGIGRDDATRTSDEGKLFRTDMKRLKEIDIQVRLRADNYKDVISNPLYVKLGGEGKLIEMSKALHQTSFIDKDSIEIKSNKFKIYLATPTIFTEKDWQPDLKRFGIKATLKSACIGKTLSIGGYDMIDGAKDMYKAIPAGSVYYYEAETDMATILEKLQGKSISDERAEQGFGIAYIGNF